MRIAPVALLLALAACKERRTESYPMPLAASGSVPFTDALIYQQRTEEAPFEIEGTIDLAWTVGPTGKTPGLGSASSA